MVSKEQVIQQALALPHEDRAYLADLLEGSLPASDFSDAEVAEAWSREIDRRVQAYDRGQTHAIEFDVAVRQIREALASSRAAR